MGNKSFICVLERICNNITKLAGCFTLSVCFKSCDCYCSVALPVPRVDLQCVFVVFTDHNHFFFVIQF